MAQHSSLEEMATAAIDEYFQAVAYCLSFRTADGGCLGFPAALLLFCITDALGNWLRTDKVMIDGRSQKIGNCPFRVFNHECFGLQLTGKEISFLEKYYRNRLAHNALIEVGATLSYRCYSGLHLQIGNRSADQYSLISCPRP